MRQRGVVVEKTREELLIKIQDPAEACGSCGGCLRLASPPPRADYIVSVAQPHEGYEVGDEVILESGTKHLVQAVAVLYGIPFAGLILGYFFTRMVSGHDSIGGIGAIAGLLVGALGARLITRRLLASEPQFKIIARACQ